MHTTGARARLSAAAVAVVAVLAAACSTATPDQPGDSRPSADRSATPGASGEDPLAIATPTPAGKLRRPAGSAPEGAPRDADRPVLGVTLTQDTQVEPADAKELSRAGPLVNVHIMGFGVDNPMPAPGQYDWSTLDARMDLVRDSGATPVITLCCSPDWMKGGRPGETDWNQLETAPTAAHYRDFAALSVAVAERYPDVRYFLVWNEMKGFYRVDLNRWDQESYTAFYNTVYTALKKHDPGLSVGGPYVVLENWSHPDAASHASTVTGPWGVVDQRSLDAVEYWLDHAAGADFVTVDGGDSTVDKGVPADPVKAAEFFAAIGRWLRARTNLPVWWAEWYAETSSSDRSARTAVLRNAVTVMRREHAAVALLWWSEHVTAPCWYCR
jgi:hypothetical protein